MEGTDFNPRSPHGERRWQGLHRRGHHHFNPRSPHGERHSGSYGGIVVAQFQSTLPARGATITSSPTLRRFLHFNPRSPHGERHAKAAGDAIRAVTFQSTLPARGATEVRLQLAHLIRISIHAPRTGSDRWQGLHRRGHNHFNPRSPHGERLRKVTILSIRIIGFAQKVYHKTVLLRISLAENAVILPEKPRNPVRTSLQKAGGLRFARAIRAARPYSISSPSGA